MPYCKKYYPTNEPESDCDIIRLIIQEIENTPYSRDDGERKEPTITRSLGIGEENREAEHDATRNGDADRQKIKVGENTHAPILPEKEAPRGLILRRD